MAPQWLGKIEFAPENGAGPVDRKPAPWRLAFAVDRPNATRPEMAPQSLETMESTPGNGAGPVDRRPAPCLPSAGDRPNASRPEMAPQPIVMMESAPGNGAASEAVAVVVGLQKLPHPRLPAVMEDLARRALIDDAALVDEGDAVGDMGGEAHFVGDDQHGHALGREALHHLQHFADEFRI